ncbi:MAG: DUF1697 domain-containing protein [Bacteroidales bacterium]|nr:DUF1697 domain-containing protein [Bacteroidales bacterium]
MIRYISILRGINVGGHKKIVMANLKVLYKELGLTNVVTYIQSGNVVFDAKNDEKPLKLALMIEQKIKEVYGFEVPIIIRTKEEIGKIVAESPYVNNEEIDRLYVTFLSQIPSEDRLSIINEKGFSSDKFEIIGKNIFGYSSGEYSDSKLSNQFFEIKLKVSATTRNWKTVLKLNELAKK